MTAVRIYYMILKLVFILVVLVSMIIVLPFNPAISKAYRLSEYRSLIPEGWAFFTRNPREPDLEVYYKIKGAWVTNPLTPMGRLDNWFGFLRKPRAQSVDLATIMSAVKKEQWSHLDSGFLKNNTDTSKAYSVKYIFSGFKPVLNDTIAIVKRDAIPWSYSTQLVADQLKCDYVILSVK